MSNLLRRIEIPIILTIVATLLQVIPYYLEFKPLDDAANWVNGWVILIVAWATFIGPLSLIQVHGKAVQKRGRGWYYSIIVLVATIVMAIVGLPFTEVGLGTKNPVYQWLFTYGNTALSGTMYAIIAFFITSAAYRAFRAKNIESTIVLLAGLFMVMSNAPIFTASWPPFKTIGDWIFAVPNMATNRAVTIGAALGAIALAVRTLMGIERGYLRGGGD
ncbi:hypothetical protein A3K78_08850 [Candidatus Bathyarchaeota archaeon RBG_13_52_12]|nr:MAG: hypothetical protein A3K78_08850 [Candidatus Bathyarchaeota archaeon RBG_13_52_12]